MKNNKLTRILLFYITAVTVSNIFRFDLFQTDELIRSFSPYSIIITAPLQASGILLGSFLAILLMRRARARQYSFFGDSRIKSSTIILVPLLLLTVFGIPSENINPHLNGFTYGAAFLVYCIFEEIGWRGYLQDELRENKEYLRVIIIGTLWYVWHLNFLDTPDLLSNMLFLIILILGSWGLGKLMELTGSVAVAAAFHLAINILFFNSIASSGLNLRNRLFIVGISVVIWILILLTWKTKEVPEPK